MKIIVTNSDGYVESIILAGAGEGNVLPLTSACNASCVFCSHRFNPPGVESFRIAPRSLSQIKQSLAFMDRDKPVVIGESTTRIIEGEPLTHPAIGEILRLIRTTLPGAPVRITTNGVLLDEKVVDILARLGNVTVYLSLNSASELGRSLLMGDLNPERAISSANTLKEYGVPFHGSIVAMPHLVGWADLEGCVLYLCASGALSVRVFLPGYTELASPALRFESSLWEELSDFVCRMREKTDVPVTCEPPLIRDLKPAVAGVMAGSPAAGAGVRAGDVIESVDGTPVYTRVDAFKMVLKAENPELVARRGDGRQSMFIKKDRGESSGLVMEYDISSELPAGMERALRRRGKREALVLTSELAGPVLEMGFKRFCGEGVKFDILVARSKFFGGSIKSAGLLTVSDFEDALDGIFGAGAGDKSPLVLLPCVAFDSRGRDLAGRYYLELEEKYGIICEVI